MKMKIKIKEKWKNRLLLLVFGPPIIILVLLFIILVIPIIFIDAFITGELNVEKVDEKEKDDIKNRVDNGYMEYHNRVQ